MKSNSRLTPIHYAALNGNFEVVKLLVEANVDINAKDELGNSPAALALGKCHMHIVSYLRSCDGPSLSRTRSNSGISSHHFHRYHLYY